jgi:hypothetical protein
MRFLPIVACLSAWSLLLPLLNLPQSGAFGAASGPDTTNSREWNPKGPYWKSYGSVLIKAVCDSNGSMKSAELLYSLASRAQTDSILNLATRTQFEARPGMDGSIRRWRDHETHTDSDLHILIPYPIHGARSEVASSLATRKDLETAGLGPWLKMWDELLPGWPFESWTYTYTGDPMYAYTSTIRDSQMTALGMVSSSPDGRWRMHPFVGVEFDAEGRPDFDVDGGFVLYTTESPNRVWQHVTGTTANYFSAEWIDDKRFVVTAVEEVDLDYEGVVFFHAPVLIFGNTSSASFTSLVGPPIPDQDSKRIWEHLQQYQEARYPKFWTKVYGDPRKKEK